MSYRTILVHVDSSTHAQARMRHAATLAHAHRAHLIGAAMCGLPRDVFPHDEDVQPLADQAREALSRFRSIAAEHQTEYETRVVRDQAPQGLALLARFADLVVISQDDPDQALAQTSTRLPEYVILNTSRPVLVVPRRDPPPDPHPRVLLAWDGSREAAASMAAALPVLRRAAHVDAVLLSDAGQPEPDLDADRPDLLAFLARHHVSPNLVLRPAQHDSGRQLLALAAELGCGLLVMGCYGHSRFRELCLGGASRTVLQEAAVALLLAH